MCSSKVYLSPHPHLNNLMSLSSNTALIVTLCFLSLILAVIIMTLITFVAQLVEQRKSKNNKQSTIPIYLAFVVFISFACSITLCFPGYIIYYNLDDPQADSWSTHSKIQWFTAFSFGSALIGCASVLIFYIYRLQISFDGSVLEISRKTIKSLIISVVITATLELFFTMNIVFFSQEDIAWILFIIDATLWLTIYVIVTLLFVKNLFKLVIMQRVSKFNRKGNGSSTSVQIQSDSLTSRHLVLIDTMTKLTILIISPSIVTIMLIIVTCIALPQQDTVGGNSILGLIWTLLAASTCSELCESVWLSFFFAEKQYYYFCKCCHEWLKASCAECAAKKLNQQYHTELHPVQNGSPGITPKQ